MIRLSGSLAMKGGDYNAALSSWSASDGPSPVRSSQDAQDEVLEANANWVPHVVLCKNPYVNPKGQAFGCGQCLPCRLNRRRVWMHRIMLESMQYTDNAYVTLTYAEEPTRGVDPRHAQLWLKRLRDKLEGLRRIRYFIVGEYGERTWRPHYHAALFGYPCCAYGRTRVEKGFCCPSCEVLRETWGYGGIVCGTLTPESAAYVAGYVTKKLTRPDDPALEGRHPEFARMSLRPGIGGDATHELASVVLQWANDAPDVPTALRHGGRLLPLGRYLTRRLRVHCGRPPEAPQATLDAMAEEMLDVRMATEEITKNSRVKRYVMKDLLIKKNTGRIRSMEARERIYKKRNSL